MISINILTSELSVTYIKAIFELIKNPLPSSVIESLSFPLVTLLYPESAPNSSYAQIVLTQINLIPLIEEFIPLPTFQSFLLCITRIVYFMIGYPDLQPLVINCFMLLGKAIVNRFPPKEIEVAAIPEVIENLNTITKWFTFAFSIFVGARQHKAETIINFFLLSSELTILCQQAIVYLALLGKQQQETLRSTTGYEQLDEAINEMKQKTLLLMNNMLFYINIKGLSIDMQGSPLFTFCNVLAIPAFITLKELCTTEFTSFRDILAKLYTEVFIVELLSLISNLISNSVFYHIFSPIKDMLLIDIVFVLMSSDVKEKSLITSDPEGFVSLASDVCEKQNSRIFKTEAARLLHTINKHLDGGLTFTYFLCTQTLTVYCMKTSPIQINDFPFLNQYQSSLFFTQTEPEYIVDTLLLILSNLCPLIIRREDLKKSLTEVLLNNIDNLMKSSSSLVKSRLILLLGIYACDLFQKQPETLKKIINFLLEGLIKEDKALVLLCTESLKNIIIDEDVIEELNMNMDNLLVNFASVVEVVSLSTFFELLINILKIYTNTIGSSLSLLMRALVKRIVKEHENYKMNIVITNCWNVINTICSIEGFFPFYNPEIENDLAPVFNFMGSPSSIDFEEDLMKAIALVIKRQQKISANMIKLYPMLQLIYEKNHNVLGNILQLINSYLVHGASEFSSGVLKVDQVIKMARHSLTNASEVIEASKAAILYQMVLQNLGNGLLDPYLPSIILEVLNYINTKTVEQVLLVQLYNVILSGISNNPLLGIKALEELGATQKVLNRILEDYGKFYLPYDRKVLTITLTTMISIEGLPKSIVALIPNFFVVLIEILSNQIKEEIKTHNTKDKLIIFNESACDYLDYNDLLEVVKGEEKKELTDCEDSDNEAKNPQNIIATVTEKIQTKLKKIDEYDYLHTAIKILNSRNPEAFKVWVGGLSEQQQQELKKILQSKRIVAHRQERVIITRRIVKPIHKLARKN